MKSVNLHNLLIGFLLFFHSFVNAEDIDLFAGNTPDNSGLPNVLIILDNSANWSAAIDVPNCYYKENGASTEIGPDPAKEQGTKMAIEKCALYNTVDALPTNDDGTAKFNVGLMLFNEDPASNSGGYPRQHFVPLTAENKDILKAAIAGLRISTEKKVDGDKGNNAAFAKAMHEAYLYYMGETPYRGTAGEKWDEDAVEDGKYVSPSTNSCGRNHIIFIANGGPGEVTDNQAHDLLKGLVGGPVSQISYPTSQVKGSDQSNWADEYARFMRGADVSNKDDAQGIITHGIAVTGASSDGLYPNYIKAMADQGYGSYYAASKVEDLTIALLDVFSQIQPVNSAFASASLPVTVNTQGTYLNQVFIGMFRPDASAKPRWAGNLKQYQFVAEASTGGGYKLFLADADEKPAISTGGTGFIAACARSFWTPTEPDTYWSFLTNPLGKCETITNPGQSNSPDGDIVEKGAAGYRLRSGGLTPPTRKVLTCNGCAPNVALPELTTTNSGLSADMVAWVRGADNTTPPEKTGQTAANMRPSVHGDVLHSRPVAVDYGGDTGVVVFYGSNDGMLRAINGNQGIGDGNEYWSFVAPEHYAQFDRLKSNSLEVYYPDTPSTTATRKDYFFDGPVVAHKSGDNVWIYATMRRGGNALYAFDVSAGTNLSNPKMKWRLDGTHLANLGQTWSPPKVLKVAGYGTSGAETPLLIMGGGYDACEDGSTSSDLNTCGSTPKGNKIYVLEADGGTLLKTFDTTRSVVGEVTVVNNAITGLAQYAYAADTGGNVYRINISGAPSTWTMDKIAALGCATSTCSGGVANRKFLFGPEVVVGSTFNAVLLGSGDREHPLVSDSVTTSVDNAFFMIKDYRGVSPTVVSLDQNVLVQIDPDSTSLTDVQTTALNSTANKGWYLQLGGDGTVHDKEQVVTSAVVVFGVVTFSTHTPTVISSNSCGSNLGTARVYNIAYLNAAPVGNSRYEKIAGGGLPPSPVAGMVTVKKPVGDGDGDGDGTMTVPFLIGGDPNSPLEGEIPGIPSSSAVGKRRLYWYIKP